MRRLLPVVCIRLVAALATGGLAVTACASPASLPAPVTQTEAAAAVEAATPDPAAVRPHWLGTRPLPLRADGFAQVQPTPPELRDRRLPTPPLLQPPGDIAFVWASVPVPPDVAARSTWSSACPVSLGDLRYLTVSFWGFDGGHHTGELLVHRTAAEPLARVFARLHELRFPIEEMRITAPHELDAPPTGDGNVTGSFVCRPSRGSTSWSEHAYGKAVDLNPFHNPYVRGDVVLPELASAYTDRAHHRPGMVDDAVVEAFAAIGWSWGGDWTRSKDWMHFSASGR